MTSRKVKYDGLEVVRALAALVVVYNHVHAFGLVPRIELLALPAQFATEAVVVFFVLSGAVITLSAERKSATAADRNEAFWSYVQARLVRIYPIYLLGLALACLAQASIDHSSMTAGEILGNAFFLQSLNGYIVPTSRYNPPLWSLSNEVFYYLLFAASIYFPRIGVLWAVTALYCAALLYPPPFGGVGAHLVFMFALSLPWLIGHWIAANRRRLPPVSAPLGFAFFVIGLSFARAPLTAEFYDAFRLTAFGACCAPLVLGLIQEPEPSQEIGEHRALRTAVATAGVGLLWAVSPSLLFVKIGLTALSALFAALSLEHIQLGLACFRALIPAFVYVGSISYALYVLHAPIMFLVNYFFADLNWIARLAIFSAAVLALSHIMERSIQPRLRRRLGASG